MHFALRTSVRAQLAIAILLAIILSWVLSGGLSNYVNYLQMKTMRLEMLKNSPAYGSRFPEPKFGIEEFFLGPHRPFKKRPDDGHMNRPPHDLQNDISAPAKEAFRPDGPSPDNGPRGDHRPPPEMSIVQLTLARISVALLLAMLTGRLLSKRFTRPLMDLSAGAHAYHSGDFSYRIPTSGVDEFSDVARAMNEMAERVSDQIAHLEDDAMRRRQFLADAAHELRSPVTTMRTMAGALADGLADDPQRTARATEALVRTSERLLRLVSDLMELAKLDLKEFPLRLTRADLCSIVGASVQAHHEAAESMGVALKWVESDAPIVAMVDPDRITQVLGNVIDNAISYAGPGAAVSIGVHGGDPTCITIEDNGTGIPAESVQHIFEPFYRVDTARNPMGSHSGLGLRITRGIVEAHGGRMELTSEEGRGTSVVISLPNGGEVS